MSKLNDAPEEERKAKVGLAVHEYIRMKKGWGQNVYECNILRMESINGRPAYVIEVAHRDDLTPEGRRSPKSIQLYVDSRTLMVIREFAYQ